MPSYRVIPPHPTDPFSRHDDRYPTKTEVDDELASKASQSSLNDLAANVYPTDTIDGMFGSKVDAINARPTAWPMLTGQRYSGITHGMGRAGSAAGSALLADYIYFTPVYIPSPTTFDRIGVNVTTAVAAATARLGIFTLDLGSGDASLVLDAGTIDASTTGTKEATINITIGPGWYWLALQPSAAISVIVAAAAFGFAYNTIGTPSASRIQASGTSGAFTATEVTNNNSTSVYCVHLRVA